MFDSMISVFLPAASLCRNQHHSKPKHVYPVKVILSRMLSHARQMSTVNECHWITEECEKTRFKEQINIVSWKTGVCDMIRYWPSHDHSE
mgnify:CR=1 FL=1